MRANEFIKEEAFGTARRRTQRPGTRPARGHEPVPTYKDMTEMDKSQTPPGRDGSNDPDAGKKEYTAKSTTAKKVAKDGEKSLNKIFKDMPKKKTVAEHGPTSRKLCVSNVSDE